MSSRKNINVSIIISLITLVASFLTSFLFVKYLLQQPQIGDTNFGLKTTADSLVSFVSVFTFGMSSTFIRFHKKYRNEESVIFSSFNIITLLVAGIALCVGIVLVILTANNLIIDPRKGVYTTQQVHDFLCILIISISYLCLTILLGTHKWFLESTKHIVLVRIINLLVVIGYPVVSLIFVSLGANMVIVTLIYSLVYLSGFLVYLFIRLRIVKSIHFLSVKNFNKAIIKEIIVFSFFVIVSCCVETFNYSADKLILTISFHASLATIYQLSITMNQVMLSLSDIIYAPYLPYLAEDIVNERKENVQKTYDKVTLLLLLLSFILLTGFISCGKEFVFLWVGPNKELVYYFTIIIFLSWPLYSMVKFSTTLHRLSDKHKLSSLLYLVSFAIHLIVTFSLVFVIDAWACVVGTSVSMLFLGIAFIFYNKKVLDLEQKNFLINLLKLTVVSSISVGVVLLLERFAFNSSASEITLLLLKGIISVLLFLVLLSLFFMKKIKSIYLRIFDSNYSLAHHKRISLWDSFKEKVSPKKDTINKLFPIVLIAYFVLNFSLYYLEGIQPLHIVVTNTFFQYAIKLISYLIFFVYSICFIGSNYIRVDKKYVFMFVFVWIISLISCFLIPKNLAFSGTNNFGWMVKTTFSIGLIDVVVGNINFLVDLFVTFMFVFVFRQVLDRRSISVFLKFIVIFTLVECIYSIIFQSNDYLYFFKSVSSETDFNGYHTNLSATFISKNGFGFLLFQGTIASLFLIQLSNRRKWFFVISLCIITLVNIFTLCKTSLIASLAALLIMFLSSIYISFRKKKKRTFWGLVLLFLSLCLIVVLLATPLAKNIPVFNNIYYKINELFVISGDATIKSRVIIWEYAIKLLKGPYILFGYGRTASAYFLRICSDFTTFTFHNGLLDILCSFGIFGFALYILNIYKSTKESLDNENNKWVYFLIISIVVSTLLYGLMENVYLFMTSSSVMFTSNVALSLSKRNEYVSKEGSYYEVAI